MSIMPCSYTPSPAGAKPGQAVRIACISDTHMRHERIHVPPCDLVVHAGDCTRRGSMQELADFVGWFSRVPARHKVFVAGNHDRVCERRPEETRELAAAHGVTYLMDEACTVEGLRVWGSPITPTFRHMAFNRDRGDAILRHWALIPEDLDILVTHGPPHGILDRMFLGMHVGCADLRRRVEAVPPRLHVFGHIHEARGITVGEGGRTRFINAASSHLLPLRPHAPTIVELR
jgi:Icc-related predicted phosphoesterase